MNQRFLLTSLLQQTLKLGLLAGILFLITACSQYSTAPSSRIYHNTTARFNAYVQARDLMLEAEKTLFEARKENFEYVLPLMLPIDSNQTAMVGQQITGIIKKASMVPERHQNSKWVDDAYLLIGKARLYKEDFPNAIETFKYINTKSDNADARHAALIWLMRAYVEQGDNAAGLRVADYLRQEALNKANTRHYYLTKAYLHQQQEEYAIATAILEETFKLMPKNFQKGRAHFATAQMYEMLGKTDRAMYHYAQVKKNNPNYELAFYADLNGSLNTPGGNSKNTFARMLKDGKNNDLKDKIYFAMAQREIQQKNYPQAIKYLQESVLANNGNTMQLSQSYLKIADVYFEQRQYEPAKSYYDSTLASLPPTATDYKKVNDRRSFLEDFVRQVATIRTEDSLQRLATMNPVALDKMLEKIVEDKQRKEAEDLLRAQQIAAQANQGGQLVRGNVVGNPQEMWYFYNPGTVSQGRTQFTQKWGSRKLEDNWRRSNKETAIGFVDPSLANNNGAPATPVSLNANSNQPTAIVKSVSEIELKAKKEEMLSQIPFSQLALAESKKKQEDAYFKLGKIYKLSLNEPKNAIDTFEKLLQLFPQTTHESETIYLLYLLTEGTPKQAEWSNRLSSKFPDSYFTRLIQRNSSGPVTAGGEAEAQRLYSTAYTLFGEGDYTNALIATENGIKNFPNNSIEDKLTLLKAMLIGKTQGIENYQRVLNQFLKNYPNSPLISRAKELLEASKSFEVKSN